MRTVLLSLVLFFLCAAHGLCAQESEETPSSRRMFDLIGKPAPDFEYKDVYGKKVRLSDFKDKVVFMNFFFIQCPPCQYEIRLVQDLVKKYKREDVVFLTVSTADSAKALLGHGNDYDKTQYPLIIADQSYQNEPDSVKALYAKGNFDLTPKSKNQYLIDINNLVEEEGKMRPQTYLMARNQYLVDYFPATFLMDKKGIVRYIKDGFFVEKFKQTKEGFIKEIDDLLQEPTK